MGSGNDISQGGKPGKSTRSNPAWTAAAALALGIAFLAACTTEDIISRGPDADITTGTASLRPAKPQKSMMSRAVGYVPRLLFPDDGGGQMPAEEVQCRKELSRAGARWKDVDRVVGYGQCGINWPVELTGTGGGTSIEPAATLSCQMALAFTKWTRKELVPAARLRYLSGVRTIRQGSSYSCRRISGSGRLSAHATGDALDVMAITLKNGRDIDVRKPGFFSFREKGFLNNVRADACPYFSTVLGPGYDRDHKDHFHFDLMNRSSGHKACK